MMRKIFSLALLSVGVSLAVSAGALEVRGITVKNRMLTMTVRSDNIDYILTGASSLAPILISQDGRMRANCVTIATDLQCGIRMDGSDDGVLALLKTSADGYSLALPKLLAMSGDQDLERLVLLENDLGYPPEKLLNQVSGAINKSQNVSQLLEALNSFGPPATPSGGTVTVPPPTNQGLSGPGGIPPIGLGGPCVSPCLPPGGLHSRHEEHHEFVQRRDTVVDTYDNEVNVRIDDGFSCFDGRCAGLGPMLPGGPCGGPCGPVVGGPVGPPCVAPCGLNVPVPLPGPIGVTPGYYPPYPPQAYGYGGYGYWRRRPFAYSGPSGQIGPALPGPAVIPPQPPPIFRR